MWPNTTCVHVLYKMKGRCQLERTHNHQAIPHVAADSLSHWLKKGGRFINDDQISWELCVNET